MDSLLGCTGLLGYGALLWWQACSVNEAEKDGAVVPGGKYAKPASKTAVGWKLVPPVLMLVLRLCLGASGMVILVLALLVAGAVICSFGSAEDQSILSILVIMMRYRNVDFSRFLKSHDEAFLEGEKTGDYVKGVCNYYELMSDLITVCSGPFWHFVPMTKGVSRKDCHMKFHHHVSDNLEAKASDSILEFGCGFGEIGRQVAKISGAKVTGLTMSDAEIVGNKERIKTSGLEKQCNIVQGNYHAQPFKDASFDKVFGVYTLKYSADLPKAISEAARVLKPGGKFMSYEITVTDKFDKGNAEHKALVHHISYSTCMPPLAHVQDYRAAAKKAGLVLKREVDLCAPANEGAWYSCFVTAGSYYIIKCPLISPLIKLAETLGIVPEGFTKFYDTCLIHPARDFVDGGRLGIIDGSVMLIWEKP